MTKPNNTAVNRRGFLKGAATAAAGAAALGSSVPIPDLEAAQNATVDTAAPPPSAEQISRDTGNVRPVASGARERAVMRPGSDVMVQALRDLGIEYVAANPGSSFEGLHESIINFGSP